MKKEYKIPSLDFCIKTDIKNLWNEINSYIINHYNDIYDEIIYVKKFECWGIKYRRKKRVFCTIVPLNNKILFSTFLGNPEIKKLSESENFFDKNFINMIQNENKNVFEYYIDSKENLITVYKILTIKKKPFNKK